MAGFRGANSIYTRNTSFGTCSEFKDFVDFTLSDAGQKIVANVGFVPVK